MIRLKTRLIHINYVVIISCVLNNHFKYKTIFNICQVNRMYKCVTINYVTFVVNVDLDVSYNILKFFFKK